MPDPIYCDVIGAPNLYSENGYPNVSMQIRLRTGYVINTLSCGHQMLVPRWLFCPWLRMPCFPCLGGHAPALVN